MPKIGPGSRVPPGGDNGELLRKDTAQDFDFDWEAPGPGPRGDTGDAGPAGPAGDAGTAGSAAGVKGAVGNVGPTGTTGDAGTAGAAGTVGDTGSAGGTGTVGAGLPAGGTANQSLRKNSATTNDTSWYSFTGTAYADTSTAPIYPLASYYYSRKNAWPYSNSNQQFGFYPATGTVYYCPLFFSKALSVDRCGIANAAAAATGSKVRFGLYTVKADGTPGNSLFYWGEGTLPTTATGGVTPVIASTIPKGWSYVALWFSGSGIGIVGMDYRNNQILYQGIPDANFPAYTASNYPAGPTLFTEAYSGTTLPAVATAAATWVKSVSQPDVFFRTSA